MGETRTSLGGVDLLAAIRDGLVGGDAVLDGPWGKVPLVYADYTASGRAVGWLEDLLRAQVLPTYANTHTESSATGRRTTALREQARETIRRSVGAGDRHAVIFCGSGSTAAIDRLVRILGLSVPERWKSWVRPARRERPLVLIGPYEHHSNDLAWRETVAEVVMIGEDEEGRIDLRHLRRVLAATGDRRQRIGAFSAASNVTGMVTDVAAVTRCLHDAGAISVWDYAAAGPYLPIAVAGDERTGQPPLDAIVLSPHKLVGGPGSPGVLVVAKDLVTSSVPGVPGGGTVSYVSRCSRRYITDVEHREEGGTPEIVGAIRAGLAFQLKEAVGTDVIHDLEAQHLERVLPRWLDHDKIEVLGPVAGNRLAIVSFTIRTGLPGQYLHHNFVVALLSDLFGIQARGGCSCAGPYGHRLLGIDQETSRAFEAAITAGQEGLKPGWTRVNFPALMPPEEAEYIVEAVEMIAEHGHRLLNVYRFELASGVWRHADDPGDAADPVNPLAAAEGRRSKARRSRPDLSATLQRAREILESGMARPVYPGGGDRLRWFPVVG